MAARTRLLERVAAIAQEKLNQPERALKAYERILATDPRNRGAALALRAALPRTRRSGRACSRPTRCCWGRRRRATALAERARAAAPRRAGSASSASGRRRWPSSGARARSRPRPKNEAVRTDLERLAGEADEWGNLAALYDARTAATTDAEERLWLLRRTLRIACTRLFRPQDARKARRADPRRGRLRRGGRRRARADPHADQGLGGSAPSCCTRAPTARPTPPSASACCSASRSSRKSASATRPPRRRTWTKILEAEPSNERALRALDPAVARRARTGRAWSRRLRRDLAVRARPDENDARSARRCCCASASIQEVRLRRSGGDVRARTARCCRRTRTRAPAVAGARAAARGAATPIRPAIARADAAVLRADGRRAPSWPRANEALLARRRHARREGRAAGEAARRCTPGRLDDRGGAPTASSLALFELDPADAEEPRRADRLRRRGAARPASWPTKLRAVVGARPRISHAAPRSAASIVAELQEKRLGQAQRRREGLRADPATPSRCTRAPSGRSSRLYRDGAALDGAARAARHAPARRARRRASGSTCWRRSPSSTKSALDDADHARRRLREDAGARPGRSARRTARSTGTTPRAERWRDLEELLGTRVRLRVGTPRSRELEFRRAELRATRLDDVDGALDLLEEIVSDGARRTRARAGCSRSCSTLARPPPARRQDPRAALRGEQRLGAPGRRPRGASARRWRATAAARAAGAHRRAAGEQAAGARQRRWRPGGRCWRSIPATPTRCREIERLGTTLERFAELVDVYQELAFKRDAGDIAGRADLLSRAAKLYAGASATGAPRSTSGSWCSPSIRTTPTRRRRPAAGARGAVHRDRRRRRRWSKILRHAGASGRRRPRERKKILFRIADLAGEVAGRRGRRGRDAARRSWRSIPQEQDGDRRARAHLRGGVAAPAAGRDAAQAHRPGAATRRARQELWRRVAGLLETRRRRRRRGDRGVRQHPRREPRGRPGARDAGAPLRAAGAPPPAAGDPRAAARRSPTDARRRACALLRADRGAARRAARRSGRARSSAGARCWRRRRPTSDALAALERFLAPGDRRRAAPGGGAGAGADLREARAATPSWPAVVRVYVEAADRRARAPRAADAARAAARRRGSATRRRRARRTALRDPRRAGGAGAAGAARRATSG